MGLRLPGDSVVKNPPTNAVGSRDVCSIPGTGRKDPLQKGMATHPSNSSVGNPVDQETWWATVHGVSKSQT